MSNYVRVREGNTYFFTVVTYQRRPLLCSDTARAVLREVVREARLAHPFDIIAWVLLPEHIHCIWQLPEADADYSMRWGFIKKEFTKRMRCDLSYRDGGMISRSRFKHREGAIWQRRFWGHRIRDDDDLRAHCDYIHYNPVKHGMVISPVLYEYSTFHRFVREGRYPADWGASGIDMPLSIVGE